MWNRTWEGLHPDKQFEALIIANNALVQAKEILNVETQTQIT